MTHTTTPRDPGFDNSLAFLREGYTFVGRRARRLGSDVFETRLMLRDFTCVTGAEAARLVYDPERFERSGVMPEPVRSTLVGSGGVQNLDGERHRHRKAMFLSLMSPGAVTALGDAFEGAWTGALPGWRQADGVTLMPAVERLLARAVCQWTGVPLPDEDVDRRTAQLAAMIDGAATVAPRHIRGRIARLQGEAWIAGLVEDVREGRREVDPQSALAVVAAHRDPDGALLDTRIAAIEVLNLLRPTVAVARYVTFLAQALHRHPDWRERLAGGSADDEEAFVHETRRFYPFFPVIAARTRHAFTWNGHAFPAGRMVMLDLYGTNRDPRSWEEPERFRPERFLGWPGDPFTLIPQGGGDHADGHRCPGEWVTIELMRRAARILTTRMTYRVPPQDLTIPLGRMPTGPRSGFRITDVATA